MKELLKKLRDIEIRIRKAVNSQMHGDFHSIFKGSGLEYDDVRAYQYGDDVRVIHWGVSAKGHGTFVKTYKEEKEQTVFFLVDVSASQDIGVKGRQKADITKEIAGILCLSAIKEQNQTGLLCFSDKTEKYIKQGKGPKHAYFMVSELFRLKPKSKRTNINKAILYTLNMVKRRSVMVIISDFIDQDFDHNLRAMAGKHDLVVIQVSDTRETQMPKMGIVPMIDKETNKTIWVNSSGSGFRNKLRSTFAGKQTQIEELCRVVGANYLQVFTDEDYVPKLVKLFNLRNKTRKVV